MIQLTVTYYKMNMNYNVFFKESSLDLWFVEVFLRNKSHGSFGRAGGYSIP